MKTINYRGCIARFSIPSHWCEEYEPAGGGTFYENRPDSGTLRLNVLSFRTRTNEPPEQVLKQVFSGDSYEILPNGLPLRRYMLKENEGGVTLHFHRWEVAIPVPPNAYRIACFAHTILAEQESDPAIAAELALVDKSVRAAEFGREAGVAGDYQRD